MRHLRYKKKASTLIEEAAGPECTVNQYISIEWSTIYWKLEQYWKIPPIKKYRGNISTNLQDNFKNNFVLTILRYLTIGHRFCNIGNFIFVKPDSMSIKFKPSHQVGGGPERYRSCGDKDRFKLLIASQQFGSSRQATHSNTTIAKWNGSAARSTRQKIERPLSGSEPGSPGLDLRSILFVLERNTYKRIVNDTKKPLYFFPLILGKLTFF